MSSTLEGPVIPSSVWFFTQGVHFNRSFVWFNMKGPLWGVQPFKRGICSDVMRFVSKNPYERLRCLLIRGSICTNCVWFDTQRVHLIYNSHIY